MVVGNPYNHRFPAFIPIPLNPVSPNFTGLTVALCVDIKPFPGG